MEIREEVRQVPGDEARQVLRGAQLSQLEAEQIPRVAQLSKVKNYDERRMIKILDKNEEYTTKSVPSPSLDIMIVKKVKAEIGIGLEKEENFENLKKTLQVKKYTKRKKSLLKKQIVDLNRKIGADLPTIPEEKCERFEGLKAMDQTRQQVFTNNQKLWSLAIHQRD